MTDFAPKIILMWANQDPKYPNSFIIRDGEKRLLGLTRTDKKGQTYWKFKERQVKNSSASGPVMDQVQKFHQRQAQTEALNHDQANNFASTTSTVNQHS